MNLLRRSAPRRPATSASASTATSSTATSSSARTIGRRVATVLLWLVVVLVLLAGLGAIYQAVVTGRGERAHPAPGALVDVGGHRLHIVCVGEGGPTVVLDAALGNMSAHWAWVQQQVATTTRVCAYDRAGLGWSEPGPQPRDAQQVTSELHSLLANAAVPGPYVLVGHSFGGLYTQLYAARYPEEVAGVVLVESSHPEQFARLPAGQQNYEQTRRLFAVAPTLAWLGVVRLFDLSPPSPGLPPEQRGQIEAWAGSTRHLTATADEFRTTPATTVQVGALGDLGDIPLAVVSAGQQDPDWLTLQNELAGLSTNSRHHIVDGATHTSVLDDAGHAQLTSTAILEVVDAVKNNHRLTG
jgi:pimeloyl-ACP methyl ester carboxylesterase